MREKEISHYDAAAGALHAGQVDKKGVAYIEHLRAVAAGVTDRAKGVAYFHDSIEDQGATRTLLLAIGLTDVEIDAIELLSKPAGANYAEYVAGVAAAPGLAGELAREVKVADLQHNVGRITPDMGEALGAKLRAKYLPAIELLSS